MDHDAALDALRREGLAFQAAVRRADPAAPVPSCPDWTVRELVRHLGTVHRWVTEHIVRGVTDPYPIHLFTVEEPGEDILAWYDAGLVALHGTLSRLDPALPAWNFVRTAPQVAGFWSGRQAHETAVHRWDAELAAGEPDGFTAPFAADGVDEVVGRLLQRRAHREPLVSARGTVRVDCTDTADSWLVTLDSGQVTATRTSADTPATGPGGPPSAGISGSAAEVYLAVWGRRPVDTLTVTGDAGLAAILRVG